MRKVKNPFNRVFSLIYELYKDQSINSSEKKLLKEAVFKDEAQILDFINEFNETQEEEKLKAKFMSFIGSKQKIAASPRPKSTKNSRTEIGKPKTDQFSPRLSSDSKLNHMLVFEKPNDHRPLKKLNTMVMREKGENSKKFTNNYKVKR